MGAKTGKLCWCEAPKADKVDLHESLIDVKGSAGEEVEPGLSRSSGEPYRQARVDTDAWGNILVLEQRLEKFEQLLKIGSMILVALIALVCILSVRSFSGVDSRIQDMQLRIHGLEHLWSTPEISVLNAKYTVLYDTLEKYSSEVHEMSHIYDNITAIRAKLKDVRTDINDVFRMEAAAHETIARVNATIREMYDWRDESRKELHVWREDVDTKLKQGLQTFGDRAVETAKKETAPIAAEVRNSVAAFEQKSAAAAEASLQKRWRLLERNVSRALQTVSNEETRLEEALQKGWTLVLRNISDTLETVSSAERRVQANHQAISGLHEQFTALESRMETNEAQQLALRKDVDHADASMEAKLKTTGATLSDSVKAMSTRIASLQSNTKDQLASLKDGLSTRIASLQSDTKDQLNPLKTGLSDAQTQISKSASDISSIQTKLSATDDAVASVHALASSAKTSGDEAGRKAAAAAASTSGVGFIKNKDSDCPSGSSQCVLWHWMNPDLKDPYCSSATHTDWAAGECRRGGSGELKSTLYGCCRD